MGEVTVTVTGTVASEPMKRSTKDGATVVGFRLASTPRRLDRSTGEWSDGETLFFGVSCWRRTAENVVASLSKGDGVLVTGRLSTRSYVTSSGEQRSSLDIDATAVGPDLSRATARPVRVPRQQSEPVAAPAGESGPESPRAA